MGERLLIKVDFIENEKYFMGRDIVEARNYKLGNG
jgi:hypothetical protein